MAKSIILIEDDLDLQRIYSTKIESAGFKVLLAIDALQGLNLIKNENPRLILLDIMLPGKMNGFELLKRLKEDKKSMNLKSPAFSDSQEIPSKYTCVGDNVNPPLTISDIPENSKSLVLVVNDPDASSGDFTHWILYNINPSTTNIEEGSVPDGSKEGINDFGVSKYSGPCPPSGTHRYQFALYAIDSYLSLMNPKKIAIEKEIEGHILNETKLTGLYSKK